MRLGGVSESDEGMAQICYTERSRSIGLLGVV